MCISDDAIRQLRKHASQIDVSIIDAHAILASTTDVHTKAIVAAALADLQRAKQILTAHSREKK